MKTKKEPFCCWLHCANKAEYEIKDGPTTDDYTHACVDHVGHLLRDDHFPASVIPID